MSHPDLCYYCENLVRHKRKTKVTRKSDGKKECAIWYSCKASGSPLPTISVNNTKHCRYFVKLEADSP